MKNIILITIFSIIILLSANSSVAVPSTEGSGGPTDIIYSSPSSINSALDSGQSVNWDLVEDQSVITDPSRIPPESLKIEQLLPTQLNTLTSSQLSFNSNINKLSDWSLLNPSARDSALSQISGNKIKTDATAGKAQKGKVEITQAQQVTTPDATLTNAQNIVITPTALDIGTASLIQIKDFIA
ncbi:MAG: hypothetical protein Q7K43_03835, partial [Candidatus Woesearchaeota archaeon]|nr:hypothetical protein [Candidatus Woesearchaeota archaeon]